MSDENAEGLKALRARTREALRAGIGKVSRLEGACDPGKLQDWLKSEAERYGGKPVEGVDE